MSSGIQIADNLREIEARIRRAAESAGRDPAGIRLVAVSKLQPSEAVRAALAAGARELGENYVQEAEARLAEVDTRGAVLHLIGHLQRNKAGRAAALFDVVQTVDDADLAAALGRRAAAVDKMLDVLVEVNISGETGKFGAAPERALDVAGAVAVVPGLCLRGLMGIGPREGGEKAARGCFQRLAALFERLPAEHRQVLSMGMTGDFEAAIAEGSTLVRIGTGIFGARRSTG